MLTSPKFQHLVELLLRIPTMSSHMAVGTEGKITAPQAEVFEGE